MVTFELVNKNDQSNFQGFSDVYKRVFSEAPYFETFTDRQVKDMVWEPTLKSGVIFIAREGEKAIGFGCGLPAAKERKIKSFVGSLPNGVFPYGLDQTFYMSDLAVLKDYRGQGIGSKLIELRLDYARQSGAVCAAMRTATAGSLSEGLYLKKEGIIIEGYAQNVFTENPDITTSSSERMYIYLNL